ncbi:serine protease inhibitor Kazal-type 12 [Sigmodon hispidus]
MQEKKESGVNRAENRAQEVCREAVSSHQLNADLEVLIDMKPSGTILLFISLAYLLFYADAVSQGGFKVFCSNYEKTLATDAKACPKIGKPVCGTDGKTYQNRCEFCRTAIPSLPSRSVPEVQDVSSYLAEPSKTPPLSCDPTNTVVAKQALKKPLKG